MITGEDPKKKSDLPGEKAEVAGQSLISEHKADEQEKHRSESCAETGSKKIGQHVQAEKQQEMPQLVSGLDSSTIIDAGTTSEFQMHYVTLHYN